MTPADQVNAPTSDEKCPWPGCNNLKSDDSRDHEHFGLEPPRGSPMPPRPVIQRIHGVLLRDMLDDAEKLLDAAKTGTCLEGGLVYGRGHVHIETLEKVVELLQQAVSNCGVDVQ